MKKRLVLNYFVNFLDGGAYVATFPGTFEPPFNFWSSKKVRYNVIYLLVLFEFTLAIGNMIRSSFKEEWCPFGRNHFAGFSAQVVSAEPGLASTQQTSCTSIIATGFTTLVMTRKLGSTMAILVNMFEINWMVTLQEMLTSHILGLEFPRRHNVSAHFIPHVIYLPSRQGFPQICTEGNICHELELSNKNIPHISKTDELDDADQLGPSGFS